ncbi:hypothetical protein COO60DRAFT_1067461 [Scenedesmus sp. NREL 46B-D3]|nr:hypothetical protein COO60DRAFT_1067461 [Scenedesmus sp. NREL 46B-D3]
MGCRSACRLPAAAASWAVGAPAGPVAGWRARPVAGAWGRRAAALPSHALNLLPGYLVLLSLGSATMCQQGGAHQGEWQRWVVDANEQPQQQKQLVNAVSKQGDGQHNCADLVSTAAGSVGARHVDVPVDMHAALAEAHHEHTGTHCSCAQPPKLLDT